MAIKIDCSSFFAHLIHRSLYKMMCGIIENSVFSREIDIFTIYRFQTNSTITFELFKHAY